MLGFIIGLWFVATLVVGYTGVLRDVPTPPPAFALLLTIGALGAVWLVPELRRRVQALGIGTLVAFHLTRFGAGIYFLVLAANGTLPGEFALVAGWGDIVVGLAVIPILMFASPGASSGQRTALLVWNTIGLIDILTVLANGVRLFGRQPEVAQPFVHLPLAILPLFVVPLVICTHLWIFAWTARPTEPRQSDPVVRPPDVEENENM